MMTSNKQNGNSRILIIIIFLTAILGIMTIVFSIKMKNSHKIKWRTLEAQQASSNALLIAKSMLLTNSLENNCVNTSGCPFWGGHHNIRLTNKDGTPNKLWWHANSYAIIGSKHNSRFIIIQKPNNSYKIIAFAEDLSGSQAIIATGYVFNAC